MKSVSGIINTTVVWILEHTHYLYQQTEQQSQRRSAQLQLLMKIMLCGIRCIYQVCYLGKLDGKDLLVLEVHEEAVHQQLVVDVPCS